MELLRRFNDDKHTKQAVKEYVIDFIGEEAKAMIFDRKDVAHIADAKDLIDKAFRQIEIEYGVQPKQSHQINEAK